MANSVLNVKVLVGVFNQEKALLGAYSMILKTNGSFAALSRTMTAGDSSPDFPLN